MSHSRKANGAASPDGNYFLPIHNKKRKGASSQSAVDEIAFAYNTSAQRLSIKHRLRLKVSYPTTRLDDPKGHKDDDDTSKTINDSFSGIGTVDVSRSVSRASRGASSSSRLNADHRSQSRGDSAPLSHVPPRGAVSVTTPPRSPLITKMGGPDGEEEVVVDNSSSTILHPLSFGDHASSLPNESFLTIQTATSHNGTISTVAGKNKKKKKGSAASNKGTKRAPSPLTVVETYKEAPTYQEQLEAERIRENLIKTKQLAVYLKPLQTKTPATHASKWDNTSTAEPVFKYNSVRDQYLSDYFSRSKHAQECLVSHGIVTKGGKLVNMHHAGGKIWLGEKRNRNAEERKAWEEDQHQAEKVVEEIRKKEMLRDVERAGRINKLRVAEHVAYLRKKNIRDKEAAKFKEARKMKILERRKLEEMEELASYMLRQDQLHERQMARRSIQEASGRGEGSESPRGSCHSGDDASVLGAFSAIQAHLMGGDGDSDEEYDDDEEREEPAYHPCHEHEGWAVDDWDAESSLNQSHHTGTRASRDEGTQYTNNTTEVSTIPRAQTPLGNRPQPLPPPPPPASVSASSIKSNSRPGSSSKHNRKGSTVSIVAPTTNSASRPTAPWDLLATMDPDVAEVVTLDHEL